MTSSSFITRRDFLDRTFQLGAVGLAGICTGALRAESREGAGTEGRWQIGCYTRPWDRFDYRAAFDTIAEAGFRYVGLMTTNSKTRLVISVETSLEEASRVGEEARQRGLKIPSVYGGGIPVAKSPAAGIAGLKKLIDNCEACGAKNLLMGGIGNKDLYERYYQAIAECCDYAAAKGIGISVKPHGGLNATGPQCRQTVEKVGHANFRIWYDPGNIYYYSNGALDPVQDAGTVDGLVVGMCIKDYRHPKEVMLTPGTGQVDFPAVMARLQQGGFTQGPLIVECLERGDPSHLLGEARKARAFLTALTGSQPLKQASPSMKGALRGGLAVVDITPPLGYRMSGYFRERLSTGVLNPLKAKALVLHQGKAKAALVFCDIIGLPLTVTGPARQKASAQTGIPAENILICATHSHTGPLYCGALRNHFHEAAVNKEGKDPREKMDYPAELIDNIVKVITVADSLTKPLQLEAGRLKQQGLSYNRRFHMKDGSVRFNPGVLNPNIVRAAGPIDPEVGTVFLKDTQGHPVGALVNFALHLDTVGGTQYAADYPYFLEASLREAFGEEFVLLFGTGTCGDINHIDVTQKERLKTETIGRTLGQTIKAGMGGLHAGKGPSLAAAREIVQAPLQHYSPDRVAWAREAIYQTGTRQLPFLKQVEAYKILALEQRGGDHIPLEVQVIRLDGETAVVGLPGEVFVDLGLAIKKASPFENTLVIELCQDAPGYVPTRKAFAEGSYETVNSRIAPGGGEMLVEAAVRLLNKLASI